MFKLVRSKVCRYFHAVLVVLLLSTLLSSLTLDVQAAPQLQGWQDTGLTLPTNSFGRSPLSDSTVCFDNVHPELLLVSNSNPANGPTGSFTYNLTTGQQTRFSETSFTQCSDQDEPFFSSSTVSSRDARMIYKVVLDRVEPQTYSTIYAIYFSADAGHTWEKRGERAVGFAKPYITILPGNTTSVNNVLFYTADNIMRSANVRYYLSNDGARTFNEAGVFNTSNSTASFYQTNEGVLRYSIWIFPQKYSLELSSDNGKSWQSLNLPYTPPFPVGPPGGEFTKGIIRQALNAPENLFLSNVDRESPGSGDLWYSPNGGRNWQKLGDNMPDIIISSYSPLTLLGVKGKKLYSLRLPQADKSQTGGSTASGIPSAIYFPETQHNLYGLFKQYWEEKGGLAQFGYPKTEPFREVNPADGKIYLVQYFERNRFEYHPENAGTYYEVLLGLLGNQLTEQRRSAGEAPFKGIANPGITDQLYFPETSHSLKGVFRNYWEQNGGLAMYGYPISEEFQETNPDDGQVYVVQYFERNRFEYHTENKGTRYEVLLGLLGNSLLREKGWL